jgi:hypothetical protein
MTTKERLHQLVDKLNDREAENALRLLDGRHQDVKVNGAEHSDMAALPQGCGETLTGEPMPDIAAAVRRSREMH